MRLLRRLREYLRVLPTARRNALDLPRWMWRRPQLLVGMTVGELAGLASNKADPRLKALAEMKVAALNACEFCLDIGAALWRAKGVGERELLELHQYDTSDAFGELDRLAIRLAEQMSATPVVVDPALRDELVERLGRAAFVDLAHAIAWEHKRSRLYHALGIQPAGFSDGLACALAARS
jgi:AhpD family alkylhydroperoxidase